MRNPASSSSAQEQRKGTDPLLICTAFKKNRFYLFSRRLPDIDTETGCVRDIVNERPNKEEVQAQSQPKITEKQNEVMLQTTLGDIHLLLFL